MSCAYFYSQPRLIICYSYAICHDYRDRHIFRYLHRLKMCSIAYIMSSQSSIRPIAYSVAKHTTNTFLKMPGNSHIITVGIGSPQQIHIYDKSYCLESGKVGWYRLCCSSRAKSHWNGDCILSKCSSTMDSQKVRFCRTEPCCLEWGVLPWMNHSTLVFAPE